MQDRIDETLRQAEAKLAELKASPQGRKLAEWDEGFGRFISYVQAAAWVIAAGIAAAMAALVMAAVEGGYDVAAAGIGAAMVMLLLWRAWSAVRRVRSVSEMVADEAAARLGPAKMVLAVASRMRAAKAE